LTPLADISSCFKHKLTRPLQSFCFSSKYILIYSFFTITLLLFSEPLSFFTNLDTKLNDQNVYFSKL